MMNLIKIPTTVVTGFLGSGKTTLMRNIMENAAGKRIAVIVNEFGELGIDGDLLKSCAIGCDESVQVDDGVYELANGCLCCTVQEEFFPVMEQLVKRRSQIDHVLIETSGLALPKPLVQAFNWPEIKSAFTVDAVITVVDGPAAASGQFAANPAAVDAQRREDDNLDHESPLHELFEDQLSAADLVLVNKSDLMDDKQLAAVTKLVKAEIPATVKVVHSSHGKVDNALMLGLDSASENTIDDRPDHHSKHHDGNADHDHDQFDSVSIRLGSVDQDELIATLKVLLTEHVIYRVKGFVDVAGKPMRLVVHGVGGRFDSYFDRRWQAEESRETLIVLIGQDLDQRVLANKLQFLDRQAA